MQICKFRGSSRLSPVLLWPPLFSFALLLVRLRPAHLAEPIQTLAHCSKPVGLTPLKNGWPRAPLNTFSTPRTPRGSGFVPTESGQIYALFPNKPKRNDLFRRFSLRFSEKISNSPKNDVELFEPPHISGSYRLRRHFPRYCDVSTAGSTPVSFSFRGRSGKRAAFVPPSCTAGHPRVYYQLAFFTPGISPFEAISRNWIRLMPN